uniref:Metalloendopeptidase n=1 Tax=Nothobranchius furzeri TaxID=105023 RepID=A0A8C6Q5B4_NOTFU
LLHWKTTNSDSNMQSLILLLGSTAVSFHKLMPIEAFGVCSELFVFKSGLRVPRGLSFREGDIAYSYARSAINCPDNTCLWPKSIDGFVYVPYILSPLYGISFLRCFEDGLESLGVPIKVFPFLMLTSLTCWSFLGQTGGSQVLSLQSPGCMWAGIAAHEFMHALGFVHEQSRSDRDHYVTIVWKNIIKQATNNLNSPYDYSSVMHYGRYAFSEDGGPTIIPRPDPYIPIGQRDGPSALDLHKINTLYDCGRYNDTKQLYYLIILIIADLL